MRSQLPDHRLATNGVASEVMEVKVTEQDIRDEDIIDLGTVSIETKGQAILDTDVGGGHSRYVAGIAQD